MTIFESVAVAVVEGLTEFLPISSTAHMIFLSTYFGIAEDDFVKLFQVSIQFGAILAVVVVYWRKFFIFNNFNFYYKLAIAVIPALVLGKLLDDKIEYILEKPIPIAIVLILGGIVFLFIDKYFQNPSLLSENQISFKKAIIIGFWQCLAMMPGTSRSAASIIGGMQQGLSRGAAAEFSFFLAVPTMLAVTLYSVFLKKWGTIEAPIKGYDILLQNTNNLTLFIIGNVVAFIVAYIAIRFFINFLKKYGFKVWGFYRIMVGVIILYIHLK